MLSDELPQLAKHMTTEWTFGLSPSRLSRDEGELRISVTPSELVGLVGQALARNFEQLAGMRELLRRYDGDEAACAGLCVGCGAGADEVCAEDCLCVRVGRHSLDGDGL